MSEFGFLSLGIAEIGFAMCYIVNGMSILNWLGSCVCITSEEKTGIKSDHVCNLCHRAWGETT